jgi:hypothetical protein
MSAIVGGEYRRNHGLFVKVLSLRGADFPSTTWSNLDGPPSLGMPVSGKQRWVT